MEIQKYFDQRKFFFYFVIFFINLYPERSFNEPVEK